MVIITKKQTKDRAKNDFYPTPYDLAERIVLDKVSVYPNKALDPGCGDGIFGYAIRNNFKDVVIHGVDIERRAWNVKYNNPYDLFRVLDFIQYEPYHIDYNLIIGNPPYSLAEAFIKKSKEVVRWDGEIVFLLKLAFLESKKRARGLFKEFKPTEVSVLAGRPSFDGTGKTNDYAFAVFIWNMKKINKEKSYDTITTWFDWN